jgi:Tol biopolymer transport system component
MHFMSLSAGTRLGPYEVLALIGAGGMGEVYRAKDTNLKRDVALKVLPASFAADPERLARFQREAEILASLNHPGIAGIYGLVDNALAMELVEGETLPSPLPVETAIAYARQIVDALEYAHDRGIIHRDLKPANIKVTPDGAIKILDFGLAKALDSRAANAGDPSNSPTLTIGATAAGVILGTAAYMSPEQAVGKAADRRADIFSFGAVLYEMLTGKRAFSGESVGETLAAVVKDQPDWSALPAATPRHVRKLLERALAKDRRQRLQAIGEARLILEQAPEQAETEAPPRPEARAAKFLWPAVAALLLLAVSGLAFVHFREAPPRAAVVNTTILPPADKEFDFEGGNQAPPVPALSPDGTRVVFGAKAKDGKSQLWIRRLDSPIAQPLPGTEGGYLPFWSPDSRWVGFGQEKKLKKIDIQGGPPVMLADLPNTSTFAFRGGSWNSQDTIVYGGRGGDEIPIMSVPAAGGTSKPITGSDKSNGARGAQGYPWFLPDGRHFLYTSQMTGDIPVRVGSLDEPGKPGKVVAKANSNAMYAQGYLLYLRENTLMAQPFDAQRLETTGGAVPVEEGIPTYTSPSRVAAFTVSPAGLLAYETGATRAQRQLVWKDRTGKVLGTLGDALSSFFVGNLRLSPDGKSLAVTLREGAATTNNDIWIYDVARGIRTRFTFDPASDTNAVWSPDGKTIYFASDRRHPGSSDLFRKASNGAGAEELVLGDSATKAPASVSPDGKLLLYGRRGEKTGNDMWVLPLTPGGKPEPRVFLETPFNLGLAQFSPDGRWIAYSSNESGQPEVYAAPFPGPGGKRQISSGGGTLPRWRRDGKEIFYVSAENQLMAAEVAERNGTLEVGQVRKLFDVAVATSGYDVSADGQKFVLADQRSGATVPLTLVQNWTAALKK